MNSPPANNLIYFPKVPVREIPQSLDEIINRVSTNRRTYADHLVRQMFVDVIRVAEQEGFILEVPENVKDLVLAFESFRSLLYKSIDQKHPLQDLASNNIELIESLPSTENDKGE